MKICVSILPEYLLFILLSLPFAGHRIVAQEASSAFHFDADHRLRVVYWDEGLFPVNGWEGLFSRHRTRAGVTWTPSPELRIRAALANEFFSWYRNPADPDFTLDEVFFDNLYIKWLPENLPLEVTLGRQNMRFGEGFVIMDGGPLDGSRSIYFNAVRVDVLPAEGHRVTLFGMHQPARDDILPLIHDAERPLLENKMDGAGIYYSGRVDEIDINAYYIHASRVFEFRSEAQSENPLDSRIDPYHLHTGGVRASIPITYGLHATIEGALQRGDNVGTGTSRVGPSPRNAHAGYAYLSWNPMPAKEPSLRIDAGWYRYSGGIDNQSRSYQYWDPLFARWPKWSESFIYSLAVLRGGIAFWTALSAPWLRFEWQPYAWVQLRTMMQIIGSEEDGFTSFPEPGIGKLLITEAKLFPDARLSGHILFERMWFADGNPSISAENYLWGRLELMYRWDDGSNP